MPLTVWGVLRRWRLVLMLTQSGKGRSEARPRRLCSTCHLFAGDFLSRPVFLVQNEEL